MFETYIRMRVVPVSTIPAVEDNTDVPDAEPYVILSLIPQ